MKQTERPIAVFDSGVGGISVLRELVRLMPNENYIFFGDSKNAPYGGKSLEEVRKLTECHVRHLLSEGAKAVVIACNTATSADVSILRKEYPDVPVVGIEPALKPAVQFMEHPRVLVMATPMTIREEKFQRLMARYEKDAEIYPLACPGIVEFVERGELNSAGLKAFLYRLLKPYCEGTVDAIVLGCTHYPFVKDAIAEVMGNTVEFLMDRDKNFYFMEMNTRLQVEHPVSELVTGKDIVKWQIRIAAGVELDCTQTDIKVRGAAIECRINAGGVGKVNFLHIPSGPWVRFDTFLYQGYEVPPFYDSMLGKMIVFSSTREEAIRKMQSALCELVIGGLPNNIEDQIDIIRDPVFHSGDYYTDFIKNREG